MFLFLWEIGKIGEKLSRQLPWLFTIVSGSNFDIQLIIFSPSYKSFIPPDIPFPPRSEFGNIYGTSKYRWWLIGLKWWQGLKRKLLRECWKWRKLGIEEGKL